MLFEHGVIKENPTKIDFTPIKNVIKCCGPIVLNCIEGMYVCDNCGTVKDMFYLSTSEEPAHYHQTGKPYGSAGSYTYYKYRPYNPLTHFREHLRRYLNQRCTRVPDELIELLRPKIDPLNRKAYWHVKNELRALKPRKFILEVWNRDMKRYDEKSYPISKFYKEVFRIIYILGGVQPTFEHSINEIIQTYKNLQYQFFQKKKEDKIKRHNMPSHFMLLQKLLEFYGHKPYYELPVLKDRRSHQKTLLLYRELSSAVCETLKN